MIDKINRAKSKIEEIIKLCNEMCDRLSEMEIWDLNNDYPTVQKFPVSDLLSKKLSSRCDEILEFLLKSTLVQTEEFQEKKNKIFSKGSLSREDIDEIIYIFDECTRELDNKEYNIESSLVLKEKTVCSKEPKIFISHSIDNVKYVQAFVELLEDMGIQENQLFCSSLVEYGIPLNEDIYEYLKKQFEEYALQVIFVLSDEYYQSAACLNEMGAAWVLQSSYSTILLPKFEFKNIRGAINPNRISIKLDSSEVSARLNELKDNMIKIFNLAPISQSKWERNRNTFIEKINTISKQ